MIHLRAKDTAEAALKAYNEKRLSAQGPTPQCMYRDTSGYPCAIGAALTDEQVEIIHKSEFNMICNLIDAGVVTTDDSYALDRLQVLHDNWADQEAIRSHRASACETAFVGYAKSLIS